MKEIWRSVDGYEGYYQVSNNGKIRSVDRSIINSKGIKRKIRGSQLKLTPDKDGYLKTTLCKNNKKENVFVHRVVASTFIDNEDTLPEVNHKDENKTNNTIKNLEWCTSQYNTNYGERNKKINKNRRKKVVGICLETGECKEYESISETKKDGFTPQSVSLCCNKRLLNSHKGYNWNFVSKSGAI